VERECKEDNNVTEKEVDAGQVMADLKIKLGTFKKECPNPTIDIELFNEGTVKATNIPIAFYAGEPSKGGEIIYTHTVDSLNGGESIKQSVTLTGFPQSRTIRVYALVDPNDTIAECNNANNQDGPTDVINCGGVIVE
jgi:hypothetical protein